MFDIEFYLPIGTDSTDSPADNYDDTLAFLSKAKVPLKSNEVTQFSVEATDGGDGPEGFSFDAASNLPHNVGSDLRAVIAGIENLPEAQKLLLKMLVDDVIAGESELKFNKRTGLVNVHDVKLQTLLNARIPENTLKMSDVSRSNTDAKQLEVDLFCDLIEQIKSNRYPGGVTLDGTKMKLGTDKRYREGIHFETESLILGQGLNATIKVSLDRKTSYKHAKKTVPINNFKSNEIRAMFALNSSNVTPKLHGFQLHDDRKITLFMEVLENWITVTEVITQLGSFESDASHRYEFALIVLWKIASAIYDIHSTGWFHLDLHGGNVMVEKADDCTINIKLLDFGTAIHREYDFHQDNEQYQAMISDFTNILKQFCCFVICSNDYFDDIYDFKMNYERKINECPEEILPNGCSVIKKHLVNIIQRGLQVKTSVEEKCFIDFLSGKLRECDSTGDAISTILNKLNFNPGFEDIQAMASASAQNAFVDVPQNLRSKMAGVAAGIQKLNM